MQPKLTDQALYLPPSFDLQTDEGPIRAIVIVREIRTVDHDEAKPFAAWPHIPELGEIVYLKKHRQLAMLSHIVGNTFAITAYPDRYVSSGTEKYPLHSILTGWYRLGCPQDPQLGVHLRYNLN